MQAGNAAAQQLLTLPGGIFDPEFRTSLVVVAQFFETRQERLRNSGPAHHGEFFDLRGVENRNNSRKNGNGDSVLGKVVTKFKKIAVIEKQLSEKKFGPGIDLVFQSLP